MSEFSRSISNQIAELERECHMHKQDSRFYSRLLVQLAMMNGGTIKIDPAHGIAAVDYVGNGGGFQIDSNGFHLLPKE